ncbi:MAG: ferric reductase-like transmembrane domain-containing protein [Pseudonocardiales bacterium]|nr:ferric reductase-like transmembrane domain-containing protein [Pseudonocardiales bacterium]
MVVSLVAGLLVGLFWASRPEWVADMRLWRAVGDTAFVLLTVTLALGPAAKLSVAAGRLLPWRRQLGVWAALAASLHALLVINGWARWDLGRLFGFEYIPQLGYVARWEPGFGLANAIGLVAVGWLLLLAVTSTDRALRRLGPAAWKWLHSGAYTVFHLSVLHSAYFLFLHYAPSFHAGVPSPNWFRLPLVALGVVVLVLQAVAFASLVRRRAARMAGV